MQKVERGDFVKKKIFISFVIVFALVAMTFCAGVKIISLNDVKYCGAGTFTDESETINYSRKETTSYSIKGDVPSYYSQTGNSNCANVAGTVLIGYYDRFCEDLIPDYQTYIQFGSVIKYSVGGLETQNVMERLYTLMGTDVGAEGTTYNGFHKGMKSYVNSCNYKYSVEDVGNLDFNKYKTAVENNKPVALFLDNYSFAVSGQDTGTGEVINSRHCVVAHVVIGCGYKIDTYYNSNNQIIATRTYLKVASGFTAFKLTYLCLDGKSKIDRATSITIQ